MTRHHPLRVLLLAEAANPEWTSVPLVGWSHSRALAELADVHLVTQVRNRGAILRAGLVEGRDFTAIDSEVIARSLFRVSSLVRGGEENGWTTNTAFASLSYYYFEHLVWRRFGAAIRNGRFDIVHRLTPLSPAIPSLLAGRCRKAGVPFVLGPLNGGVPWPKEFDAERRREKEWLLKARSVHKLLPGYRSTLRNSAAILAGSRETLRQIPRRYWDKCTHLSENAIDPALFTARRQRTATAPIRIVFVGRLVPCKAVDVLIEAAAPLVRDGRGTVEIIGDGPVMNDLVELVGRESVQGGVRFAGWVPHEQLQQRLAAADVFAFPSIREFGGGAVLEAMAVGLAPVVTNYGGPAELVTEETGFLVEMGSRAELVTRFRQVLSSLANDPGLVEPKAAAALRRVHEQFTWREKARQVVGVYRNLLDARHTGVEASATPEERSGVIHPAYRSDHANHVCPTLS